MEGYKIALSYVVIIYNTTSQSFEVDGQVLTDGDEISNASVDISPVLYLV